MKSVDFTFRYDPSHPISAPPADANAARNLLEAGNRLFAQWLEGCRQVSAATAPSEFVIQCHPYELGLESQTGEVAHQTPFAIVVGCSDARAPAEMIFGQARNNLFVIRLAGNVLTNEGLGSVEYAVHNIETIRIIVVLGHSGCGAVTAAVKSYLNPWDYLEKISTHTLRSIVDRVFTPVRKAANSLKEVWGPDASKMPNYENALIETSVSINAAQAAYDLRQKVLQAGKSEVEVLFGVLDLATHRVKAADASAGSAGVFTLAPAPRNIAEFEELAIRMAIRASGRDRPNIV